MTISSTGYSLKQNMLVTFAGLENLDRVERENLFNNIYLELFAKYSEHPPNGKDVELQGKLAHVGTKMYQQLMTSPQKFKHRSGFKSSLKKAFYRARQDILKSPLKEKVPLHEAKGKPSSTDLMRQLENEDLFRIVQDYVTKTNKTMLSVAWDKHFNELSHKELMKKYDLTLNNTKTLINRGKNKLQGFLSQYDSDVPPPKKRPSYVKLKSK